MIRHVCALLRCLGLTVLIIMMVLAYIGLMITCALGLYHVLDALVLPPPRAPLPPVPDPCPAGVGWGWV